MSENTQNPQPPQEVPGPRPEAHPAPAPRPMAPQYQPPFPPGGPAPKPAPFKRGFGLGAGAGLGFGLMFLVLGLVGSLLTGMIMAGFSAAAASAASGLRTAPDAMATVWGPETATQQLRSIPVRGAIMTNGSSGLTLAAGTYGYEVAAILDDMTADDAAGVVLMLDTPGGTVTGSKAISDAVDRYRERTGKKVFAFVEGMSASGGMYAMAGADEIVADHGGITGSVGVIMGPQFRYRDVTEYGDLLNGSVTAGEITAEYITAGRGKDAGQPFRDMTPEERAELQAITDSMYADFVDHVATKRGIDRNRIVNEFGAGIFANDKAQEIGYIDAEMGRDEAMRHFAEAAGLDPAQTRVVEPTGPSFLDSLLGAEARPLGVSLAAQPAGGQPARPTASLCTDPTTPLAWHGPLVGVCG